MCAPNDIWSLGVILVNLTCGRNPWKQASFQDSTYRAFSRCPEFLKTILPITDELNDILGRIFNPCPERRISLPELRQRILACTKLTATPTPSPLAVPTPPATPDQIAPYVTPFEEAIMDDYEIESPLSPASTISDDGSLTSSGSTISDSDEDFIDEQQQHLPPQQQRIDAPLECAPPILDTDMIQDYVHVNQEFVPQMYSGPVPITSVPPPLHQQPVPCAQPTVQAPVSVPPTKSFFPLWDVVRYVHQQVPVRQSHGSFHAQAQMLPSFHGCF